MSTQVYKNKIEFIAKTSKSDDRRIVNIPKELIDAVSILEGKFIRVTLEEL